MTLYLLLMIFLPNEIQALQHRAWTARVLHSRNINISGNIIKPNLWTSMNERTHFFIKIYISHSLFSKGLMFLGYIRDGWGGIYSARRLLLPISFSGGQRVPMLAPPFKLVRDASGWLRVPLSTAILYTLSKSDRVVLITWSPSGYALVRPECSDVPSSSCFLI